jgi:hypothetical protein
MRFEPIKPDPPVTSTFMSTAKLSSPNSWICPLNRVDFAL